MAWATLVGEHSEAERFASVSCRLMLNERSINVFTTDDPAQEYSPDIVIRYIHLVPMKDSCHFAMFETHQNKLEAIVLLIFLMFLLALMVMKRTAYTHSIPRYRAILLFTVVSGIRL